MRVVFTSRGWAGYSHWLRADRNIVERINRLIDDALRDPFTGISKPEQLRHALTGPWSRRITEAHRLI